MQLATLIDTHGLLGGFHYEADLVPFLIARAFTRVQTGGGCTAWTVHATNGDDIVVTSCDGGSAPTSHDWLIGRYRDHEWLCEPGRGYSFALDAMDADTPRSVALFLRALQGVQDTDIATFYRR